MDSADLFTFRKIFAFADDKDILIFKKAFMNLQAIPQPDYLR
jgi:hypothetical protein